MAVAVTAIVIHRHGDRSPQKPPLDQPKVDNRPRDKTEQYDRELRGDVKNTGTGTGTVWVVSIHGSFQHVVPPRTPSIRIRRSFHTRIMVTSGLYSSHYVNYFLALMHLSLSLILSLSGRYPRERNGAIHAILEHSVYCLIIHQ